MKKILIVLAASALLVSCNSISNTSDNAESETPAIAAEWLEPTWNEIQQGTSQVQGRINSQEPNRADDYQLPGAQWDSIRSLNQADRSPIWQRNSGRNPRTSHRSQG